MSKDFVVILHDGTERAKNFMEVFGRRDVHVKSFVPTLITVPGFSEPQAAYMLDLDLISPDERARLVAHLAERFGIDAKEIDDLIGLMGVPILASDCTVAIEHPQRWIDDHIATGQEYSDDDDFDYDYDADDDFDDQLANCGMTPDGLCMLAGSEYCDWECRIAWDEVDELLVIDEDDATAATDIDEPRYPGDEIPF